MLKGIPMPYRHWSLLRRLLSTAAALAFGLAITLPAAGQTVDVLENTFFRSTGTRDIGLKPTWVNYADCINDDIMNVTVRLETFSGYDLEVWAANSGSTCQDLTAREGSAATCWKVFETDPSTNQFEVSIRSRDVAAQNKNNGTTPSFGPGSGTLDDCEAGVDGLGVSLYFMLIDSGGNMQGTSEPFESGVDLLGPEPPSALSAGIGEERLIIEWDTASTGDDLRGYRLYCDPPPGGSSAPASTPTAADGGADAMIDGAAGSAATDAGADAAGTGGSAGSAGSAGAGGTGGGTGNPACPSALVSGERPDEQYRCGTVTGQLATQGEAEGLVNGVTYAVGVAAVDDVDNAGPLSEIVCGTPQVVDDFFELYRRSGGKGGGGFCQISSERAGGWLAVMVSALGALGWRRSRRKR